MSIPPISQWLALQEDPAGAEAGIFLVGSSWINHNTFNVSLEGSHLLTGMYGSEIWGGFRGTLRCGHTFSY